MEEEGGGVRALLYSYWSSLTGAAPGRGSCPIQRPLTFDLIYTDYHGLGHLQGAMGLAFQHYKYDFPDLHIIYFSTSVVSFMLYFTFGHRGAVVTL